MSSHREAPEISKDPVADNTDLYAFVSPDAPDTVTIIANYIPLEDPPGGPNFFEFGDDVLYSIYIDNDGDGLPNIEYQFKFKTKLRSPKTFLYNTGPITAHRQPELEPAPVLHVSRVDYTKKAHHNGSKPKPKVIGHNLPCPPCNIGPRSTPNYQAALGDPAVRSLQRRRRGLRRPAQRGVLRRPRVDLRPRRPAPVAEPAPDRHRPRDGRRRDREPERAHDRDPGADQRR